MDSQPRTDGPVPPLPPPPGLGAELRESLLLLGCALGLTVGLTVVAQAALSALA
ncbi:MAG: hypothetical protein WD794_16420 [Mycobacteriales bacterium]